MARTSPRWRSLELTLPVRRSAALRGTHPEHAKRNAISRSGHCPEPRARGHRLTGMRGSLLAGLALGCLLAAGCADAGEGTADDGSPADPTSAATSASKSAPPSAK